MTYRDIRKKAESRCRMKEFIEKLICKLENLRDRYQDKYGFCSDSVDYGKTIGLNDSISIVNQLAEEYNNDFCEWKKKNSNEYVCNAHAEIHDSRVLDWCVCPYCGKKIKVVE